MNYEFNDNSIITGYIKELLKDFNLPSCKVYRPGLVMDPGRLYIDGVHLIRAKNNTNSEIVGHYAFGEKILNITKNLSIKSSVYDSITHEYLGEYLRFIRDFKGVDLMPLYNCFSNYELSGINLKPSVDLDTDNNRYRYWAIPVKFGQTYTIAIDSVEPYSLMCLIEQSEEISKLNSELIKTTVNKPGSSFDVPFLFKTPDSITSISNYWKFEPKLKLVIKLPASNKSSISIIEGDYRYLSPIGDKSVCTYADGKTFERFGKASLLNANDLICHPFADKLVEYLLGGVISPLEYIENNIARLQKALYKNGKFAGNYDLWGPEISRNILYKLKEFTDTNNTESNNTTKVYSVGGQGFGRPELISGMRYADKYFDCLGYGDKDIETILGGK